MNWVDLVVVAAVLTCGARGVKRGLRASGPEMLSFVLAFVVALVAHPLVAWIFAAVVGRGLVANGLGLLVVWLAAQWGMVFGLRKLLPAPKGEEMPAWERAGGAVGALEGLVLAGLLFTLCVVFPNGRLPKQAVMDSALGRPLVEVAFAFEGRLAEWLGGPFGGLGFRTLEPGGEERIALHFHSTQVEESPEIEKQMLALVNRERRRRGAPALAWDERLAAAARAHSRDMLARGYMGHVNPDGEDPGQRIARAGANPVTWGENVAVAPTLAIAHAGLMSSPGHRANILNAEYGRVGIGVVRSRVFGTAFTQNFSD